MPSAANMMSVLIRIFADKSSIVADTNFSGCGNKPMDLTVEVGVRVGNGVGVAFEIATMLSLSNNISQGKPTL